MTGSFISFLGETTPFTTHALPRVTLYRNRSAPDRLAIIAPRDTFLLDENDEVRADLFRTQKLGRPAEVLGERGDPIDIRLDRVR